MGGDSAASGANDCVEGYLGALDGAILTKKRTGLWKFYTQVKPFPMCNRESGVPCSGDCRVGGMDLRMKISLGPLSECLTSGANTRCERREVERALLLSSVSVR